MGFVRFVRLLLVCGVASFVLRNVYYGWFCITVLYYSLGMSKKLVSLRLDSQNCEDIQHIVGYLKSRYPDVAPTQSEAIRFALRQVAKSVSGI